MKNKECAFQESYVEYKIGNSVICGYIILFDVHYFLNSLEKFYAIIWLMYIFTAINFNGLHRQLTSQETKIHKKSMYYS